MEMNFDDQFTKATAPFGLDLASGDKLEQPEEYGVGIGYVTGAHTFAFDYKKAKWSEASGYSDFGWEDADIYIFGYEYAQNNWAVRAGYNYSSSVVVDNVDPRLNFFNLLGFPATAEKHYTVGGTYEFSKGFSVDLAYVYQAENVETFDISSLMGPGSTIEAGHREDSISFQLNYKF